MMVLLWLVLLLPSLPPPTTGRWTRPTPGKDTFHTYEDVLREVEEVTSAYPNITMKEMIGKSVKEKDIVCVKIGQNITAGRPLLRPMVKLVANMHGNEVMGLEMMIILIRYLTSNYGKEERITKLVDNIELSIVPTMNPDNIGWQRENKNKVDLNRAFPTWKDLGKTSEQLLAGRQPEVRAMGQWILENPFVLSINFHDGSFVMNYPWDDESVEPWLHSPLFLDGDEDHTPDEEIFKEMSLLYARNHKTMYKECVCKKDHFHYGITRGNEWYTVRGGMQDFNYLFTNCMEITAEILCGQNPHPRQVQEEWGSNKEPLLKFLELTYSLVRGIVTDREGNPAHSATVRVDWVGKHVVTTERGEYWRVLAPGKYVIKAVSEDNKYESQSHNVEVLTLENKEDFLRIDFTLDVPRDLEEEDEPDGFQFKFLEKVLRNPVKNITIPRVCVKLSFEEGIEWC